MNNTILIVEDEDILREIIKDYLLSENYKVLEAADGKEALHLFQEHEVHLLILDIMLPELDGWSVCRRIRKTSNVPIIMLTARVDEDDTLLGFELGADDYVTKPYSPPVLLARTKRLLDRNKLSQKTKETVYLATRENLEGVYIDSIDSPQILKISEPIGLRLPLYIGASNRAILAHLPTNVQEAILADVDWTTVPSLISLSKEIIQKDLEIIRSRGYAVTSGEATDGTTGIGAPMSLS